MDSEEGKKIVKQREINYRKLLIEQKKQEPTTWDNFGEEEQKINKNKKNKNLPKAREENKLNDETKSKFKTKNKKSLQNTDTKSKQIVKKTNNSKEAIQAEVKQMISEELLNNFDSKKLSFQQTNYLRAAITKNTAMACCNTAGGASLDRVS